MMVTHLNRSKQTAVMNFLFWLFLSALLIESCAFQPQQRILFSPRIARRVPFFLSTESEDGEMPNTEKRAEDDIIEQEITSTVRIDDGGSDLTDRFKYKVNALMGAFDPADETADNEQQSGNILNAMLKFPVKYTFNVVGKTEGVSSLEEEFVEKVKAIVTEGSGDSENSILCKVTPRTKNFTKVTVQAQVDSSAIITAIYQELQKLELSVMHF